MKDPSLVEPSSNRHSVPLMTKIAAAKSLVTKTAAMQQPSLPDTIAREA